MWPEAPPSFPLVDRDLSVYHGSLCRPDRNRVEEQSPIQGIWKQEHECLLTALRRRQNLPMLDRDVLPHRVPDKEMPTERLAQCSTMLVDHSRTNFKRVLFSGPQWGTQFTVRTHPAFESARI